jgi:hypothetical protein
VIGEQQDRVKYAASRFEAEVYKGLPEEEAAGLLEDSEELRTAQLKHNEDWINRMKEEGRLVIDTGPAEQRVSYPAPTRPSDWPQGPYEVELSAIENYPNVIRPWEDMTGTPNFPWKYDSSTYSDWDGYYKPEQNAPAGAASDSQTAAGSTLAGPDEMSSRDVDADQLQDSTDYLNAEAERLGQLGIDPAIGGPRVSEQETAVRVENDLGIKLERYPGPEADWVDANGLTYDAVGNFDGKYFDQEWSHLQQRMLDHLAKADYVPVDVSKFTPAQVAQVQQFIESLGPRVFLVGN